MSRRLMLRNASGGGGLLPPEYQRVEFIQSNGYQYIDTGVYGGDTTDIEVVYKAISTSDITASKGSVIFSAAEAYQIKALELFTSSGYPQQKCVLVSNGDNSQYNYNIGLNLYDVFKTTKTGNLFATTNLTSGNSSSVTLGGEPYSTPFTIHLFAVWRGSFNSSIRGKGSAIYSYKQTNNGVLVRNMFPCYRKSDGVIGMFDTVSNTFFTNAGTGAFKKGADV